MLRSWRQWPQFPLNPQIHNWVFKNLHLGSCFPVFSDLKLCLQGGENIFKMIYVCVTKASRSQFVWNLMKPWENELTRQNKSFWTIFSQIMKIGKLELLHYGFNTHSIRCSAFFIRARARPAFSDDPRWNCSMNDSAPSFSLLCPRSESAYFHSN